MPGLFDLPDEVLLAIHKTGLLNLADLIASARSCRRLKGVAEEALYVHNRDRQACSAVIWAAVHGNIATLDKALAYNLCINQANYSFETPGRTPLLSAVVHGQDSAVTWFLDHGANLTRVSRHIPCKCSFNITSILHAAICFGHASTARLLISRGAALEYRTPEPDLMTERTGLVTGPGMPMTTALLEASFYGLDSVVEVLVKEHGMDPQTQRGSDHYDALALAARNANNVSMIRLLVSLGADVDGSYKLWSSTPLHLAISGGNFAVAHALLDLGAQFTPHECDVDVPSCGMETPGRIFPTPLHDAIASIHHREERFSPRKEVMQPFSNSPRRSTRYPGFIQQETNDSWRAERIRFIQRLIDLGVDVNMKVYGMWKGKDVACQRWEREDMVYEAPLGLAAAFGGATEWAMLIAAGAKVEKKNLRKLLPDGEEGVAASCR